MQPCLAVDVDLNLRKSFLLVYTRQYSGSTLLHLIEIGYSRISGMTNEHKVVINGVEGGVDIRKCNFQEVTVFSMQFGGQSQGTYGIISEPARSEPRLLQPAYLQQEGLAACQEKVGKDLHRNRQQDYRPVVAAAHLDPISLCKDMMSLSCNSAETCPDIHTCVKILCSAELGEFRTHFSSSGGVYRLGLQHGVLILFFTKVTSEG